MTAPILTPEPPSLDDAASVVRIIDDDASVRVALADLFASIGIATRTFASTHAYRETEPIAAPGCLILDLRMPGQGGLDFQREIAAAANPLPIIFVTGHGDVATAVQAMKAGAADFFLKPFDNQALIDAVNAATQKNLAGRAASRERNRLAARYAALNDGERQVLDGVVRGALNKHIAVELGLSEVTVKVRRGQLMRKTVAASLPDLVRMHYRLFETAQSASVEYEGISR